MTRVGNQLPNQQTQVCFSVIQGFLLGKWSGFISTVKLQCNTAEMGAKWDRWHHVMHRRIMIYHKVSLLFSCLSAIISSQNGTVSKTWHQIQHRAFISLALVWNDIFSSAGVWLSNHINFIFSHNKMAALHRTSSLPPSNGVDVWAQTDCCLHRFSMRRPQRTPSLLLPSNKARNKQRTRCSPA